MATYSTIRYGSRGDDVKALQNALNAAGYSLDEDGIFGSKTQAAVKQYQKSQGLTVDGIVGKNTWGALNSAPSSSDTGSSSTNDTSPAGDSSSTISSQLAALMAQMQNQTPYTPKTDEEIRQQAEGEYQSYYDQLRLAAQQQQEKSDIALAQQRAQLETEYQKQKEQSAEEYAKAYSQSDRQMLSRGMQRSSYGAQTLANLSEQGAQAQQTIADAQAKAQGNIDAQRTQLAQQLAQQLTQYDASKAADVMNRIREIEDQEYERTQESQDRQSSLSAQIYQLLYQQERDKIADQQWQAQFDESQRQFDATLAAKKSSSSSSSKTSSAAQTPSANTGGMTFGDFMSALGGGSTTSSSAGNSVGKTIGSVISGAASSAASALSSALKNAASKQTTTTSNRKINGSFATAGRK